MNLPRNVARDPVSGRWETKAQYETTVVRQTEISRTFSSSAGVSLKQGDPLPGTAADVYERLGVVMEPGKLDQAIDLARKPLSLLTNAMGVEMIHQRAAQPAVTSINGTGNASKTDWTMAENQLRIDRVRRGTIRTLFNDMQRLLPSA